MDLNRRINRLESQILRDEKSEVDMDVESWARLFASVRADGDGQILEEDRESAREFIAGCRAIGKSPSMAIMLKMACEESSS